MEQRPSDNDIIERTLSDDPEAFGELVRRYQNPVGNYVYRMVGDYDTAADLLQDIFFRAYGALARHDRRRKFFSWLLRIAHNHTLNHLKKRRPAVTPIEDLPGELATSSNNGSGDPMRASLRKERATLLRAALQDLPDRYRAALVCRYEMELSYEEIAAVVGRPVGKVKSDLDYGRKLLRERLEGKF